MEQNDNVKLILILYFLFSSSIVMCQIPKNGADLHVLSNLQWGMTKQEVKDRVGNKIETVSDTVLSAQDSLVGSTVTVLLTFSLNSSTYGLNFIEVDVNDNNVADKLLNYLKSRYGENYQKQHQEQTKLIFFKLKADSAAWTLETEGVALMTFWRGDDVISIRLIYSPKQRKTK